MNKLMIIPIILFIILEIISKKIKEPLMIEYTDEIMIDNLDEIIKYINNSIDSRVNGVKNKNFFSDEKYQGQLLPLRNASIYATYIKNKLIKK